MSVGSAFDERALELNVRRQWREWSGVFSSSAYAPHIDIEYNALRNAAGPALSANRTMGALGSVAASHCRPDPGRDP